MPETTRRRAEVMSALLALAGAACASAYGAAEDPEPVVPGDDSGPQPLVDGSSGDATADVGSDGPLPGRDGGADDAAILPTALDASSPPGCPGLATCDRVVFVSSLVFASSEVATADAKCTALAAGAAALPRIKGREFQAWVSYALANDPASRFVHGTGRYIRPDDSTVTNDWVDLTDGKLLIPIVHDETGAYVSPDTAVWTGTSTAGTFQGPNCSTWTTASGNAVVGLTGQLAAMWTASTSQLLCSQKARLYCFEK